MTMRLVLLLAGAVLVSSLKMQSASNATVDVRQPTTEWQAGTQARWWGSCVSEERAGNWYALGDVEAAKAKCLEYDSCKWIQNNGCNDWAWRICGSLEELAGPDAELSGHTGCTLLRPPPASDSAGGHGDPHLRNIDGDRFNVHKAGSVPLLKIPAGGKQLKIMGLIEAAKRCSKTTFITQLNLTGSWLEKKIDVAVHPNETESSTFFVAVDGQRVWTHSNHLEALKFDHRGIQTDGSNEVIFKQEDGKVSVRQLNNLETAETKPGLQLHFANAPSLLVTVTYPRVKASTRPHLNLDVKGLHSPGIVSVGGILGSDDHSEYEMKTAECQREKSFAKIDHAIEEHGSTAEASW